MSVLLCKCGFSAGTRNALQKHFQKNADSDQHGPTAQTTRIIELSDKFGSFDENQDRSLDFVELKNLLRKSKLKLSDREIRFLFEASDTDKDGLISFDEFLTHIFTPAGDAPGGRPSTTPAQSTAATKMAKEVPVRPKTSSGVTTSLPVEHRVKPQRDVPDGPESPAVKAESKPNGTPPVVKKPQPLVATQLSSDSSPGNRGLRTPSADLLALDQKPGSWCATPSSPSRQLDSLVRFLIIRHGRSANKHRAKGEAASNDPELSEQGYEQAEALGKRLANDLKRIKKGDVIIASSPMKRCLLTIRPAIYRLNLDPGDCIVNSCCYEFGCAGLEFPGTPVDTIATNFPEFAPMCFNKDGSWEYLGESDRETEPEAKQRAERIVGWIWDVAQTLSQRAAQRQKVFVLSFHQTMADLICQALIDGTTDNWVYGEMTYKLQNTAITEILLDSNGTAKIGARNDFAHLHSVGGPAAKVPPRNLDGGDGRTAKLAAQLREKFSIIDKTGDFKLDFKEMSELLRCGNPRMTEKECWAIFTGADTSKDGDVDFDEFLDYIFSRTESKRMVGLDV